MEQRPIENLDEEIIKEAFRLIEKNIDLERISLIELVKQTVALDYVSRISEHFKEVREHPEIKRMLPQVGAYLKRLYSEIKRRDSLYGN